MQNSIDEFEFRDETKYKLLTSSPPSNGISWQFWGWSDGNQNLIRTVALNTNKSLVANYKAKNHSAISTVVQADSRRQLAEDTHSEYVFRAYHSKYGPFNRIYLQYRPKNSNSWSNEFLLPLPLDGDGYPYMDARNPHIASSRNAIWVVYEVYEDIMNDWRWIATLIKDPVQSYRSFSHYKMKKQDGYNVLASADVAQLAVAGDNGPSYNGHAITVGYLNSTRKKISLTSLHQAGSNPMIQTQLPQSYTIPNSYVAQIEGFDVAVHYGKIGLVVTGNSSIIYKQAKFNYCCSTPTMTWTNISSTVATSGYPFFNLIYAPSIINWGSAFKIVFPATFYYQSEPYQVIAMKNIGSGAKNTSMEYLFNDDIDYYIGNYFEHVQASKVNANSSNPKLAITVKQNRPNYGDLRLQTYYVHGNYNYYSIKTTTGISNRSVAEFSTTSKVHGVYSTPNQGLRKLNEIDPPTSQKVTGEDELAIKGFKGIAIHYSKNKNHQSRMIISEFLNGEQSVRPSLYEDSTGVTYLTDWFEADGLIAFKGYINEKGRLPFELALVTKDGEIIETTSIRNRAENRIEKVKKNRAAASASKQSLFKGSIKNQMVRIQLLKDTKSVETMAATIHIPVAQDGGNEEDVTLAEVEEIPEQADLMHIYPNPFNPNTTFSIKLEEASDLTITLFDITGKLVNQVVNEYTEKGVHTYQFNAGNLASGVYFVKVILVNEHGEQTVTSKRITLIK